MDINSIPVMRGVCESCSRRLFCEDREETTKLRKDLQPISVVDKNYRLTITCKEYDLDLNSREKFYD